MDEMREALEKIARQPIISELPEALGMEMNSDEIDVNEGYDGIIQIARQALAAPKWTFPDEDTPGEAPEWRYQADPMDYSFYSWKLRDHREPHNEDPVKVVVLARFNEGPPNEEETRQIMERADED